MDQQSDHGKRYTVILVFLSGSRHMQLAQDYPSPFGHINRKIESNKSLSGQSLNDRMLIMRAREIMNYTWLEKWHIRRFPISNNLLNKSSVLFAKYHHENDIYLIILLLIESHVNRHVKENLCIFSVESNKSNMWNTC